MRLVALSNLVEPASQLFFYWLAALGTYGRKAVSTIERKLAKHSYRYIAKTVKGRITTARVEVEGRKIVAKTCTKESWPLNLRR